MILMQLDAVTVEFECICKRKHYCLDFFSWSRL
jgi:hypothetical protein